MKYVIDISENRLEVLRMIYKDCQDNLSTSDIAIVEGKPLDTDEEAMELMTEDMSIDIPIKHESKPYLMIPLPDGATNGDVIKTMFPQIETRPSFADSFTKVYNLDANNCEDFKFFNTEWWNAPYKAESEVRSERD